MCIQISETPFLHPKNYVSMGLNNKKSWTTQLLAVQPTIKRRPKLNSYKTK